MIEVAIVISLVYLTPLAAVLYLYIEDPKFPVVTRREIWAVLLWPLLPLYYLSLLFLWLIGVR